LRQSEDPELYAQLAHHWARVGDPDKSAGYYLEAGRQARKRHAHEDAIKFLRAALDQRTGEGQDGRRDAGGADLRAEIHENLGDLLALSGSHADAEEAFRAAIASVPVSDTLRRAQIWRKVGKTWSERNVQKQALASYDEAAAELGIPSEESVNSSMEWQEWVEIQNERVWSLYWMGQVDELASNVGQLADVVERRGSPLQRAKFHLGLCITELRRQRYRISAAAVSHARAALLAAEASAEASEVVATRLNLSIVLMFSGALDEAETLLERALEKAERVGDQVQRARVTAYLSTVLRMQGQSVRARMFARKAIDISSRAQKPHYVAIGHANLGWAHWRVGESAASAHLSEALALWAREKDVFPFQWLALWPVLAIHARNGDCGPARDALAALLDAQQQRLPADLEDEVRRLAAGTDCTEVVWITRLRSLLECAEQHKLL
jgi:tetratricopeptide (TPR) repeat protein